MAPFLYPESIFRGFRRGMGNQFETTRWSVVIAAGKTDTPASRGALTSLCQTYWPPLYAYARRRGYSVEDAEDMTQEFVARLIERGDLRNVAPEKGRFRSFLLAAFNHFLSDEWDKVRAEKRGGGARPIAIDTSLAESHLADDSAAALSPERAFERKWALTLLDNALSHLEDTYGNEGKSTLFGKLRFLITVDGNKVAYAKLARDLGMSDDAVKMAAHRLRKRYRDAVRAVVADTVSEQVSIEAELQDLFRALSR